jgi:hypothetical protein
MTSGDRRRTTRRFSLAGWARNSDQLDLPRASFEASLREAPQDEEFFINAGKGITSC